MTVCPCLLLQPAQKPADDYVSDVPNIKDVVVISHPDGYELTVVVDQMHLPASVRWFNNVLIVSVL